MDFSWKDFLQFILYLAVVGLLTYSVVHFVGQRTVVKGSSMEPTLSDGDQLIVDKVTYHFREPKRFDIIVFPYQYEENTYYIKRVIGLPGESVRIDEKGIIYINGEELIESYGREVIKNPGLASTEITLQEDEYFVLGDNRNNSMDSRTEEVGLIKKTDIVGRAFVRIYPLEDIGSVLPQKEK